MVHTPRPCPYEWQAHNMLQVWAHTHSHVSSTEQQGPHQSQSPAQQGEGTRSYTIQHHGPVHKQASVHAQLSATTTWHPAKLSIFGTAHTSSVYSPQAMCMHRIKHSASSIEACCTTQGGINMGGGAPPPTWGMMPSYARTSGARHPTTPSIAQRPWMTSLYLSHRWLMNPTCASGMTRCGSGKC